MNEHTLRNLFSVSSSSDDGNSPANFRHAQFRLGTRSLPSRGTSYPFGRPGRQRSRRRAASRCSGPWSRKPLWAHPVVRSPQLGTRELERKVTADPLSTLEFETTANPGCDILLEDP